MSRIKKKTQYSFQGGKVTINERFMINSLKLLSKIVFKLKIVFIYILHSHKILILNLNGILHIHNNDREEGGS